MSIETPDQGVTLHYADEFHGVPVDQSQGPLITPHLHLLEDVLQRAQIAHSETLAVQFDLLCPNTVQTAATLEQGNGLITLFWQNLLEQFFERNLGTHPGLRYAWTREYNTYTGQVVYKALILINARAFNGLYGEAPEPDPARNNSLAACIVRAWGKALRRPGPPPLDLVYFPTDPHTSDPYTLRLSQSDQTAWRRLFTQSSTLCKAQGKPLRRGFCVFRTSNR